MDTSASPRQVVAAAARQARRERIHTLRMRVVAIAVALFVAAWVGLYLQLVSGHDPALASSGGSVATQSADPSVTDEGWSGDDSSAVLSGSDSSATSDNAELSSSDESSSASSTQSSAPAAATTGQS